MALSNDEAQTLSVRITGTVRDAGQSLPLANVQIGAQLSDGRQIGAVTDANGRFEIKPFPFQRGKGLILIARRIGYGRVQHQVVVTDTVHTAHIILSPANVGLSELVVTADRVRPERSVNAPAAIATVPVGGNQVATFEGRGVAGGIARGLEMKKSTIADLDERRVLARGTPNREQYDRIEDNPFLGVRNNPLSTFSIDVDRASYGNVRRFLTSGQRPPKDAVRIEELINYFPYTLPEPRGTDPVAISTEVVAAPWQPQHRLVRVALQARRIETANLPPNNLVFLIDVSGSMNEWNKLPLVKQSLRLLVNELRPQDRVAIVAYAGAAGLVLPSTSGDEKARIAEAIERLEAGGSTAGGAGIELAYRTAREHFLERGNNRVILATDGDFNVGVSSDAELERLIEQRRRDGTYLTVLGFGSGNYQAAKMEKLAKVGNGNFGYVDTQAEARKMLVEEMGATLLTVANDVKLQVEFNPTQVRAYRLIGYENRLLATEDFNDDTKDAGDIGAGHQVTALYEVVPAGVQGTVSIRGVDSLRYVAPDRSMSSDTRSGGDELMYVKLRYKRPGNSASQLLTHPVSSRVERRASTDLRFIAAVASFGMLLRDSEYKGNSSAAQVLEQARAALGDDKGGYRAEFVELVERWRTLGVTAGERR
ncbi:VWA domain-containing protein [Gemmatimonas sp.]